nr:MAG: glycoprotein [XiangYun mono-chu-like virus 8]
MEGKLLTIIAIQIVLFNPTSSIIAYDCNGDKVHKTSISLVDTPSCTFSKENVTESEMAVAVTQSTLTREVPFLRCLVVAYHHIWRCGSVIDTNVRGGDYAEVLTLTIQDCENMIYNKKYQTTNGNVVNIDLDSGGRMSFSYTSWGTVSESGSCDPGPVLASNGAVYDKHTRNTRLEMWYTKGSGRMDVERKLLLMPNGMQCTIEAESCELADYGQVFWKQPTPTCKSEVDEQSLVYKGPATLITNHDTNDKFVHVSFSGHHFQIKLEQRSTYVCGFRSYYTEHPKLFITLLDNSFPDFPLREVTGTDVNMMNYINSKLVYSLRHVKDQVMDLYRLFEHERCLMQNRITSNLLTLAILSPVEFAYQYFGEPGYTAVVRGEVVHIARCVPVPVVPKHLDLCYDEMPVVYNNVTMFMMARTRLLMKIGTIVECSSDLGARYKFGTRWVTMVHSGLLSVEKPNTISPDPISYEFEGIEEMMIGGLYTKETISKYQHILTSPMEESVLTSRMNTAIRGGESMPANYPASNIFSTADLENIQVKISSGLSAMVNKLLVLGNWFSLVVMIGWVLNTIISLINCGMNYYLVKPEVGFIVALFTCCFSSIYHLISRNNINSKTIQQVMVKDSTSDSVSESSSTLSHLDA